MSHAVLFHQSYDLAEEYAHVKPDDSPWTALRKETGKRGSSYAVGYSLLSMPFLAVGTLCDAIAGHPADGYSRFAILGYCLTNIFLTGFGTIALFGFLRDVAVYWGITATEAAHYAFFTTFATFFGTNAGYYAFSPMSHASTFFGVSVFLALWWRIRDRDDLLRWALLGLIGGGLSISRWQDIFFIGGPLLSDLFGRWYDLKRKAVSRMLYLTVAALCWIPQLLEWKYIYGKYFTVPQGNNFFAFPPPFVLNVLFSTRNGWFAWTPVILIGMIGLVWSAIRIPRLFLPWILIVSLEVALISSLIITWHGGEGFSNRNLTSSAPLAALGILGLLCFTRSYARGAIAACVVACCLFTTISAVQFRLDFVPRSDTLTASEYLRDKFRLGQVRRRKISVREAESLLERHEPAQAARLLEAVDSGRSDRDVLRDLSEAYRQNGQIPEAGNVDRQLDELMRNRLF